MKKPLTNRWLQSTFVKLSEQFFDSKLALSFWTVHFKEKLTDHKGEPIDGLCSIERKSILLDSELRKHYRSAKIALLHEMTHGIVRQRGHRGPSHSIAFHIEQNRLYCIGAYDGLI